MKEGTGEGNIAYPFETHLKPKSREISFIPILLIMNATVLKFCPEHDSIAQNFKTIGS